MPLCCGYSRFQPCLLCRSTPRRISVRFCGYIHTIENGENDWDVLLYLAMNQWRQTNSDERHPATIWCFCDSRIFYKINVWVGSVMQWQGVGLVIERSRVRLPAGALRVAQVNSGFQRSGGRYQVNRVPAYWLGLRRGAFSCVGQQVTLCDPI